MIYVTGYTPDERQDICVYSFSHETGLRVIKTFNTREEAEKYAEDLTKGKPIIQLELF